MRKILKFETRGIRAVHMWGVTLTLQFSLYQAASMYKLTNATYCCLYFGRDPP